MKEAMNAVCNMWNAYWNGTVFYVLFLIACLYLLICGKKSKAGRSIAVYQLLTAIVFFCPVTAWVIQKCVGSLVYWRVIWLFPTVPLLAYAAAMFAGFSRKWWLKTAKVLILVLCIAFVGKSVWQAGNFVKVGNHQQIPDEVAQIAEVIAACRTSEESLVAADDYVASYLRVYDASIQMPYGREARGARSRNARYLYRHVMAQEPSYWKITRRAKLEECEFLVLPVTSEKMIRAMKKYGYPMMEQVAGYGVFKETAK